LTGSPGLTVATQFQDPIASHTASPHTNYIADGKVGSCHDAD